MRWKNFRTGCGTVLAAIVSLLAGAAAPAQPLTADLQALMARQQMAGAVVALVDGAQQQTLALGVFHTGTRQPLQMDDRMMVGSVAKTVLSLALLRLVTQDRLALDAPLASVLPQVQLNNPWADRSPVRVRHLLDMTAGLPDLQLWHLFNPGHAARQPLALALRAEHGPVQLRTEPGRQFGYSNLGFTLAAMVVEAVTGEAYEDWTERELLAPLGMHNSRMRFASQADDPRLAWGHLDEGQPVAERPTALRPAMQLATTAGDMVRLMRFVLGDGRLDSATGPAGAAASGAAGFAADVGAAVATDVGAHVGADVGADVAAHVGAEVAADVAADVAAEVAAEVAADTAVTPAFIAPALMAALGQPQGTDAARAGLRSGYGLGFFTRDRHGAVGLCHGGSVAGWRAMLCVFRAQQRGFFIALNSDREDANYGLFDARLVQHLGVAGPAAAAAPVTAADPSTLAAQAEFSGWYVAAPGRLDALALVDRLFGFWQLRLSPGQASLKEGFAPARPLLPAGALFRQADRQQPTLALLRGDDGQPRLAGGHITLRRISPWTQGALWAAAAAGALALLAAAPLLVWRWRQHGLASAALRLPATVAVLALAAVLAVWALRGWEDLGAPGPVAWAVMAASLALPTASLLQLWMAARQRAAGAWLDAAVALGLLGLCALLASHGLWPLRPDHL